VAVVTVYATVIERAIEGRKRGYGKGDRVRLDRWGHSAWPGLENGEPSVPPGTEGTVTFVDDLGTVHVDWDSGSKLGATLDDFLTRLRCAG
jgi:hypothetical protein